jgi:hypothetical protein
MDNIDVGFGLAQQYQDSFHFDKANAKLYDLADMALLF